MTGRAGHEEGEAMSVMDAATRLADAITEDAGHRAQERLREAEHQAATRVAAARGDAQRLLRARREGVAAASDELLRRAQATLNLLTAAEQAREELGRAVRELAESAAPPSASAAGAGGEAAARLARVDPPPDTEPPGTDPSPGVEPSPEGEPPSEAEPPLEPEPEHEPPPEAEPPRAAEDPLSSARLVALQLAVGGSSRSDAVRHLERELGIRDAGAIVDDVFAAYAARRSEAADGGGQ